MKKKNSEFDEKIWKNEFDTFMNPDHTIQPRAELSQEICQIIHRELSPSFGSVLKKLAAIQLFSGSATLLVCPQFGIGPLGGGHGILGFIEPYGPLVCGAFCGAFFLVFSGIIGALLFSRPDRKKVAGHSLLAFASISVISFVSLALISMMVSNHQHHTIDLSFVTMWFASGILMGSFAFRMISALQSNTTYQARTTLP